MGKGGETSLFPSLPPQNGGGGGGEGGGGGGGGGWGGVGAQFFRGGPRHPHSVNRGFSTGG